jgi:hypothetical protein
MQKIAMVARWSFVFLVMSFYTLQSLSVFGLTTPYRALAEEMSTDEQYKNTDDFMVDEEVDGDSLHTSRLVCALTQSQLDTLRTKYSVDVKISNKDGKVKALAVVKGTKKTKKADIYRAIGVDKKSCKIMKKNVFFMLFLLPGVS